MASERPAPQDRATTRSFVRRKSVRLKEEHDEILSGATEDGPYANESEAIRAAIELLGNQPVEPSLNE